MRWRARACPCVCVAATWLWWRSRSRLHVLSPEDTGWLRGFVVFNGSVGQRFHTGYSTSDHRHPILLWGEPAASCTHSYLDCTSTSWRTQLEIHHTHTQQPMYSLHSTLSVSLFYLCLLHFFPCSLVVSAPFCLTLCLFLFITACVSLIYTYTLLSLSLCVRNIAYQGQSQWSAVNQPGVGSAAHMQGIEWMMRCGF